MNAKAIMREQWGLQDVREKTKDRSAHYPTYGRGLHGMPLEWKKKKEAQEEK